MCFLFFLSAVDVAPSVMCGVAVSVSPVVEIDVAVYVDVDGDVAREVVAIG